MRHIFKKHNVILAALLLTSANVYSWETMPENAPTPADNPTTPEKVTLGKMLFFDPRFSSTGTVSCNSCHNVMEGGDDSRAFSMGVHGQLGGRSAPTVWNSAFHSVQFWDGRAASLEEQAKGPVVNPVEMGMSDIEKAMDRVRIIPGYKAYFDAAFSGSNTMSVDNAAKAVAAYERTLITRNSPFDRYINGDKKALTEQQVRGMGLFQSNGCQACHSGPAFNGPAMPAGTGFYSKFPTFADSPYTEKYDLLKDKGRADVTKSDADLYQFRVPTLRNIADTAPYFHNGSVRNLDEAVKVMAKTQLNNDISDNDAVDIAAFLVSLSGEYPEMIMPRLPPTPGTTILMD